MSMKSNMVWTGAILFSVGCGNFIGSEYDGQQGEGGGDGAGRLGESETTPSGPSGPGEACKHVDLVFSVDNSGSMSEEKAAMRDVVFPAFAERLKAIGKGLEDYRAGVLDACPMPAAFHTRGVSGPCNFAGGRSWMESTSPKLTDEFRCVGDIWSGATQCTGSNDDEQPGSTIAAALGMPANAGFLRDEALLVAVAITDEDETPTASDASAKAVYDRLVATKGDVRRIVFLGIGGGSECSGVYGDAENATKLKEVTSLFTAQGRGVFWDLCNGKLEDGLAAAMNVIETACNELPPPVTK